MMKTIQSVEELLAYAKKEHAELVKSGAEATDWEHLEFDTDIKIADFVEKRFAGMNETNIRIIHELDADERRLEQMEESARKTAAQVMLKKYRECHDAQIELNFECQLFATAQNYLYQPKQYKISDEIKKEFRRRDSEKTKAYLACTEKLTAYQNFMGTFFMENAVTALNGAKLAPDLVNGERALFEELAAELPDAPEYEVYKTRAAYENQKPMELHPAYAVLEMNPNVLTSIKADQYPAKIRKKNPSRLDLEWGASTFDNMIEGLYTQDELKEIRNRGYSMLNTIFLDGKPVSEQIPMQPSETRAEYEKRAKAEVAAFALEAEKRIDIAPYRLLPDHQLAFKEAIPVQTKVNLEEKHSGWKKFLNFFGVKTAFVKEKVEKLNVNDLQQQERAEKIHQQVAEMAKRENESYRMRQAFDRYSAVSSHNDLAFFGFLTEGVGLHSDKEKTTRLNQEFQDLISAEVPKQGGAGEEKTKEALMLTMYRQASRASMVGLYALSKGMTLDELLSPEPQYNDRKRAIGAEFVDRIGLIKEEEFYKINGENANYQEYVKQKQQDTCQLFVRLNQVVAEQASDVIKDCSAEALTRNYAKLSFLTAATQDLFQSCPPNVKKLDEERLEQLEIQSRTIGEMRYVMEYCNYIASEPYVQALNTAKNQTAVKKGVAARMWTEKFSAECQNTASLADAAARIDRPFINAAQGLLIDLSNERTSPERFRQYAEYASTGRNPVAVYDAEKGSYQLGTPKEIAVIRAAAGKDKAMSWMDFEEPKELKEIAEKRKAERNFVKKEPVKTSLFFSKRK